MDFLILTGATWYLAYALTGTDGVFGIFEALREWRGGRWHGRRQIVIVNNAPDGIQQTHRIKSGMLDCIVCTSFWIGIIAAWLLNYPLIWGIGAAGFACLLHSYTGWRNANY